MASAEQHQNPEGVTYEQNQSSQTGRFTNPTANGLASRADGVSQLSYSLEEATLQGESGPKTLLAAKFRILFLCTAHNSLSQRLYLLLSTDHIVSIEYALSADIMISAVELFKPDLIIGSFLTAKIPAQIYEQYMTLIVHPGPPGDAGPSAIDWLLMGDDGSIADADSLMESLNKGVVKQGRRFWGVSIIQATEEFDAGPIWAFEQFPVNIDSTGLSKSELYRGPVTRAAVRAVSSAIDRITDAAIHELSHRSQRLLATSQPAGKGADDSYEEAEKHVLDTELQVCVHPKLAINPEYGQSDTGAHKPFLGGQTYHRPLLKPKQRAFDLKRHSALEISRRLKSADSQPGVLSDLFGPNLYLNGGIIEEQQSLERCIHPDDLSNRPQSVRLKFGHILGIRHGAICLATVDGKGIWITHLRRLKRKIDAALWPKVPAVDVLLELDLLSCSVVQEIDWPISYRPADYSTFQEVSIEYKSYSTGTVAFVQSNFYNGAMSTEQCQRLLSAMQHIILNHEHTPISAVVLSGGPYFSNGIALNTIEAASDPSDEAWANINAINDIVFCLLHSFATAKPPIKTIAAMRGNAAAGGVALAASCDVVLAGEHVVLNPAYRASGLYGSEYHTISYPGRCGSNGAHNLLNAMLPISPYQALEKKLVDHVVKGWGQELNGRIYDVVGSIMCGEMKFRDWKADQDLSLVRLARARAHELGEMSKDFWSARSERFNNTRRAFVRKIVPTKTPLRFAVHRRSDGEQDLEESSNWDNVFSWEAKAIAKLDEEVRRRLSEELRNELSLNSSGIEESVITATSPKFVEAMENTPKPAAGANNSSCPLPNTSAEARIPTSFCPTISANYTSVSAPTSIASTTDASHPSASRPQTVSSPPPSRHLSSPLVSGTIARSGVRYVTEYNNREVLDAAEKMGLSLEDTRKLEEAGVDAKSLFGCYYERVDEVHGV